MEKLWAARLAKQGRPFRVGGRSEQRLRRDFRVYEPLVEYCAADLSDSAAAARAAAGVDTLFYTVGVPYPQFEQHPRLTRVALAAAAAAGVRHYVHLSTVYPYGVPQHEFVSESHPRNPTAFKSRMRKEQEDLVFAADDPKCAEAQAANRDVLKSPSRADQIKSSPAFRDLRKYAIDAFELFDTRGVRETWRRHQTH